MSDDKHSLIEAKDALEQMDDLLFQPSPMHQTLKAQFWARFEPSPLADEHGITLPLVQSLVNDSRLKRYWSMPGFREWFTNKDENRERLEYLWMVGLDTAEQLLRDPLVQSGPKVNLIKLIAEVSGRLVRNAPVEKFSDAAIDKMSETELRAFLEKKGVSPKPSKRSAKVLEETVPKEEVFS